jgi:hypothetical protein
MSRTGWISLLVVGTCAGFVVRAVVGTGRKPRIQPRKESVSAVEEHERNRVSALERSLGQARKALAQKEEEIEALTRELAEMRAELSAMADPDELRKYRQWQESLKQQEHQKSVEKRLSDLRKRILQRKDKGLRAQAVEELVVSLQSNDGEDRVLAMNMIPSLKHTSVDMEMFKPSILASVKHNDVSVKRAALDCLSEICGYREMMGMAGPMASDPYPDVRAWAAEQIAWLRAECGDYDTRELIPVLRGFLHDEDKWVRAAAIEALWRKNGEAQEGEVQDLAIELSRDPELAPAIARALDGRGRINATIARRLVEMYDEGHAPGPWEWDVTFDDPGVMPMLVDLDLKVLRSSIEHSERLRALEHIRGMRSKSMLPELEEIFRSDDAEGIKLELEMLIYQINTGI